MLSSLYIAGENKIADEQLEMKKKRGEGTQESSISDTILSPVYIRFNSSGPLTTVFDPTEAVIVSTAPVFVCHKVYIERKGEESSSE